MFIVFLAALLAGLIQGIAGFGSGPVLMMVLPTIFLIPEAAAVSSTICMSLNFSMVYQYRKHIDYKEVFMPAILYLSVSSITIYYSIYVPSAILKKIFGVFLIILSVYYLFIQKNKEIKKLSLTTSLLFIMISGMCDGFFGIGGPLMVIYFLTKTNSTQQYLGTTQAFFGFNNIINTLMRMRRGILSVSSIPVSLCGIVAIFIGGILAKRVVSKFNADFIKKCTYIMIGITGILNLI